MTTATTARICLLVGTLLLSGCSAYWARVAQARRDWNAYVNSPAYYETTYTSTYSDSAGNQATCDTTCSELTLTCRTRCY